MRFLARIFDEFFSGFRAKFQNIVTCAAFSIKFAKTNQKFAENSEFCENYSLFFKIIHFTPYLWYQASLLKVFPCDRVDALLRSRARPFFTLEPRVGDGVGSRALVERFDRRGIEPFELFTSEFGQNSFKIQEFSLEKFNIKISEISFKFFRSEFGQNYWNPEKTRKTRILSELGKFQKIWKISTFSKISAKFRQNFIKI